MDTTPYLTPTVRGIINEIRQTQDYSALPILADALQDVDFPDEKRWLYVHEEKNCSTLDILRNPKTNWIHGSAMICFILGGEYEESHKWITEFVIKLREDTWREETKKEMTYSFLMQGAHDWIERGDTVTEKGGTRWESEDLEEFWRYFEVVTGRQVDQRHKDDTFFSCSC